MQKPHFRRERTRFEALKTAKGTGQKMAKR